MVFYFKRERVRYGFEYRFGRYGFIELNSLYAQYSQCNFRNDSIAQRLATFEAANGRHETCRRYAFRLSRGREHRAAL